MEIIKHALGVCSDNHTHIDLLDLLLIGTGGVSLIGYYLRERVRAYWFLIKSWFKRRS